MKRPRGPVRRLRRFDDGGPVRRVNTDIPAITPGPQAQVYQPQTSSESDLIGSGIKTGLSIASAFAKHRGGKVSKVIKGKRR